MTVVDMRKSSKGANAQTIRPGVQLNQADITFAIAALAGLSNVAGLTNFTLRYVNTTPTQLGTRVGHRWEKMDHMSSIVSQGG